MPDYSDCAAVWIAGRHDYAVMAQGSAASVKKQMPDLRCILVTDQSGDWRGFEQTVHVRLEYDQDWWYRDSVNWCVKALETLPQTRFVFLDTDTYTAEPWWGIFDLLGRFDIAAAHAVTRHTTKTWVEIPDAFPEFEVGVLGIHKNERTLKLFRLWKELFDSYYTVYGNNDQGPFREAVWRLPEIKVATLTVENHCRWGFGCYVAGLARILHSRNTMEEQAEVARIINAPPCGMRLFRPNKVSYRPGRLCDD
jgi:hypothetical protein